MGNISADQHNMTRRATKAKRKASPTKRQTVEAGDESVLSLAIKERRQKEWIEAKKAENRERLLKQLNEKRFLEFTLDYDPYHENAEEERTFHHNVRDMKAAIKALPPHERRQYRWDEGYAADSGTSYFRVAKIRTR